jgi:hypothetical protein
MNKKNFFWVVAAAVAACTLSANPASATAGWSVSSHISTIQVDTASNGIWITVDATTYNDNCAGSPVTYFLPDDGASPANTKFKSQLSTLMAAYMQGTTVNFYVSGCSTYGNPVIQVVKLNA